MSTDSPFSPGLKGVIAGETSLAMIDGGAGRLQYRGYPIGELVERGSYAQVAELLWTGQWRTDAHLPCATLPAEVTDVLRRLPASTNAMDALRTAVSAWGAVTGTLWPPTVDQARAITALAPSALAAFARLRDGLEPIDPDPELGLAAGFLYQLRGARPDEAAARALDAYFVVGTEHGFNASTFTARVIVSTHSDTASAVAGAIGALKGPWHGGAPSEVVDQLHQIGSVEQAEPWIRATLERGERLMGFGHRVYRAYDRARRRCAPLPRGCHRSRTGSLGRWRSRRSPCECWPNGSRTIRSRPTSSTTPRRCSRASACRRTCSPRPSPWLGTPDGPPIASSRQRPTS
jgi:citrate synthase